MVGSELEVEMKSDTLRVLVLPAVGGKIASLCWQPANLELLQAPLRPYGPRNLAMGFEESDASGFDECLPSVSACAVKTPHGTTVPVPDHGDFWRLPWECTEADGVVRMSAQGVSLPLYFERTLQLVSEGKGGQSEMLAIEYRVTNTGDDAVDYAWSAHPLFAVEPGDRIVLPASVQQVQVEGSAAQRLGDKGAVHTWPHTKSSDGSAVDLSVAGGAGDGVGDKLFAAAPREGWAAIERVRQGVRIEVSWAPQRTSWMGLWLCYGGWPEGQAQRQQCVAIEPCTAPADSLAEAAAGGWAKKLAPGASDAWWMKIRVAALSRA